MRKRLELLAVVTGPYGALGWVWAVGLQIAALVYAGCAVVTLLVCVGYGIALADRRKDTARS